MNKKLVLMLPVFLLVSAGAFAQFQLSAGGGLIMDMSFGNGIKYSRSGDNLKIKNNNILIGGYGFFDATYAEASLYMGFGLGKQKWESNVIEDREYKLRAFQIGFTVLGKYPFHIGKLTVFPMAGISYNFMIKPKFDKKVLKINGDEYKFNQFGFLFGGGLDFDLTDRMYLRGTVLMQIRLKSEWAKEFSDYMYNKKDYAKTGFGPEFRVGVGFKF